MKKLLLFALLLPTLAGAQIVKPGKPGTGGGSATPVVNNLNQSTTGSALDATQGKALATMVAGKLSISDTTSFIRKITGWRLISPTEINKLANTSGVNTGDQSLSLNGTQLTLSGNGGTVNLPSGGSSTPLTNNLTTTTTGTALDAAQGKNLKDQVDAAQTAANNAQSAANTAQTTANGKQNTLVSGTSIKTVGGQPLLGSGDIPLPSATPLANNLTTTTTGSALDATQGKTLSDSLAAQRTRIANNATALAGKQPTIGTTTPITAGVATFTEVHVKGANQAETDAAVLKYLSGFGPIIAGWGINFNTLYNQGNGILKTDGTLTVQGAGVTVQGSNSAAPIAVFNNSSGTGQVTINQTGQVTVNSVKFAGDGSVLSAAPTGGGSSPQILYITTPSSFASSAAGYNYIQYDGSTWVRSSGNVDSNPDNNPKYTALQYNAGSDHFDRQYAGYAMFSWWRNSSGNAWQQMKYAINHTPGAKIQVEDGTYTFTENVYSPGNFEVRGNLVDPKRCVLRVTGTETRLFRGWFWYDGVTPGQLFENIKIHGFTFDEASTGTNSEANNNGSYGPICFEGASSQNISITDNIFLQSTTTARVNGIFIKAGANKLISKIEVKRNRANVGSIGTPINPKARIWCEIINQDHPNNDQVTGQDVVVSENDISGWDMGISVAGVFDKTVNENNKIGNTSSYCIETAGTNTNVVLRNNRFYGTNNVIWASNYHGENGTARGDYPIPANTGQTFAGNRTLGFTTGIIEVRGSGNLFFNDNDLNISGGVYLRRNSLGGVVSAEFKTNHIVTNATASNMSNKAVVYLAGATNVRAFGNTFERTSTDTQPLVQAVSSGAEDGATGTNSTGSLFMNNYLQAGATPTSYFSATAPNTLSATANYNQSGIISN